MQNEPESFHEPIDGEMPNADGQADESQHQMPLSMMTGQTTQNESELDFDVFEEPKKGIPALVLVLIVVFAVGGGVMLAMRSTGSDQPQDQAAVSAETKIDEALQQLASMKPSAGNLNRKAIDTLFEDADRVVGLFQNDPVKHQVSLDELSKNPFQMIANRDESSTQQTNDYQHSERIKRLNKELSELNLQSILISKRSMAIISGKVVRPGEKIGSFTMTDIEQGRVVLQAEGETFELRLEQPRIQE